MLAANCRSSKELCGFNWNVMSSYHFVYCTLLHSTPKESIHFVLLRVLRMLVEPWTRYTLSTLLVNRSWSKLIEVNQSWSKLIESMVDRGWSIKNVVPCWSIFMILIKVDRLIKQTLLSRFINGSSIFYQLRSISINQKCLQCIGWPIKVLQLVISRILMWVLAPLHLEYSPENKVYTFFLELRVEGSSDISFPSKY